MSRGTPKIALQPSGLIQECRHATQFAPEKPAMRHRRPSTLLGRRALAAEFYRPNLLFFLLFGTVSFSKSDTTSSNLLYGTKITYNRKAHHTAGPTEANTRPLCS